jgi:uncharacterized protein YdiU (UPF0061 family)
MNCEGIETGLNLDASFFQKLNDFYLPSKGEKVTSAKLIKFNEALAIELGFNFEKLNQQELAQILTGSQSIHGSESFAQVYAGHQFGGFSPTLGDGRALLIAELLDINGVRKDIHLKGSGKTPFSRGGDGKAALGPVLREYIMGEAMFALKVPATRGLAVTLTGETVVREQLLSGAVLARVASSHIRVGTFQYFAAKGKPDKVKQLADYTIVRHFPHLDKLKNPYLGLLTEVRDRQAALISQWVLLGFVHGVMNTDNVAISGETIDFGPCAFIDKYDADAVFSSIDRQGRYSLSNQPYIAQWNIARFAETLLPLLDQDPQTAIQIATQEVQDFSGVYQAYWLRGVCNKLGLEKVEEVDYQLATNLFRLLEGQNVDYTSFFRSLSQATIGDTDKTRSLFKSPEDYDVWHNGWMQRLSKDPQQQQSRIDGMNAINPIYIPRNHLVEEALDAAQHKDDFTLFEKLLTVLAKPYEERTGLEKYTLSAPSDFGPYKTFCGT